MDTTQYAGRPWHHKMESLSKKRANHNSLREASAEAGQNAAQRAAKTSASNSPDPVAVTSACHFFGSNLSNTARMRKDVFKKLSELDRQYWLYAAIIFASMLAIGQVTNPFIAHDDYDWLNGQSFGQGFESPWSKSFSEGRWIEYLWSLFSTNLGIGEAFAIYLLLYSCLCFVIAKLIRGRAGVLIALTIFFAPMGADAMLWPVTQIPAMAIYTLAFALLGLADSDAKKIAVLPLAVIGGFLSYPAFSPVLLLCYGLTFSGSLRSATFGVGIYMASFVAAVLLAFTLNYIFHGHFTIQPAPWRHSTPLFTTGTLSENTIRYLKYYNDFNRLWPALIVSGLCYAIWFFTNTGRSRCLTVLIYGLVILLMEAALCILSGVDLPMRSSTWIWILFVAPCVVLLRRDGVAWAGGVGLLIMLGVGLTAWHGEYRNIQKIYPTMHYIGEQTSQAATLNVGKFSKIVTYGDARAHTSLSSLHSNRMLRNYLFKEFGIVSTPCEPAFCQAIAVHEKMERITSPFLILNNKLVIVLSTKAGDGY